MVRVKILQKICKCLLQPIVTIASWAEHAHDLIPYRKRRAMRWQFPLMIGVLAVAFIFDISSQLPGIPIWISNLEGKEAFHFWIGTRSIFDLFSTVVTSAIAFIAAILALRSYRLNQRAAVANRYLKGVELLGNKADSSKLGGVELLSVVALEAYNEYQEPVIRTLRQFLQERSIDSKSSTSFDVDDSGTLLNGRDLVATAALSAIARTDFRRRWLELEYDRLGLELRGIFLHKARFAALDFSRIRFEEAIFGDVVFESCKFAETLIDIRCFGRIRFHACSFQNVEIIAKDSSGILISDFESVLEISENQRTDLLKVNHQDVSDR